MNAEHLRQIQQWYADPIRKFPRKVRQDVAALLRDLDYARSVLKEYADQQIGGTARAYFEVTERIGP